MTIKCKMQRGYGNFAEQDFWYKRVLWQYYGVTQGQRQVTATVSNWGNHFRRIGKFDKILGYMSEL